MNIVGLIIGFVVLMFLLALAIGFFVIAAFVVRGVIQSRRLVSAVSTLSQVNLTDGIDEREWEIIRNAFSKKVEADRAVAVQAKMVEASEFVTK